MNKELTGTSFESFEEAVLNALGEQSENQETFEVVRFSVERGGIVGRPQFHAVVRRLEHR